MPFPLNRMRRLRRTKRFRSMVGETRLDAESMIYPIFVCPGKNVRQEIGSMPGQYNLSVDQAVEVARETEKAGVGGLLVFGLPETKDDVGSGAYQEDGIVQRAFRAIRENVKDLILIGDVCLCEYTSHGHCGIVSGDEIVNDITVGLLARTAVSHAEAGADIVAPSDMMDGRVAAIREALDTSDFQDTAILSYAAKYCSAYYGPFRDAAESTPAFGDRRTHQMDPANVEEALREGSLDLQEGADMIMVKPALHYLDVISRIKDEFGYPTAAYHVSGEYAMLKAASERGWIDENRAMLECLTAIKRAGADIVVTYYAREAARLLA